MWTKQAIGLLQEDSLPHGWNWTFYFLEHSAELGRPWQTNPTQIHMAQDPT
jgi:hypothetical protein